MTHVYFAIRSEKRWLTRSMIVGWIPRQRYLAHYDPARWPLMPRRLSSQLIDNLNAWMHLRALLTDLFVIDELLRGIQR
jgi:hypothetical protein